MDALQILEAESLLLGRLARLGGIRPTELPLYALRNCDAARHLYRVTSGLESMIDRVATRFGSSP